MLGWLFGRKRRRSGGGDSRVVFIGTQGALSTAGLPTTTSVAPHAAAPSVPAPLGAFDEPDATSVLAAFDDPVPAAPDEPESAYQPLAEDVAPPATAAQEPRPALSAYPPSVPAPSSPAAPPAAPAWPPSVPAPSQGLSAYPPSVPAPVAPAPRGPAYPPSVPSPAVELPTPDLVPPAAEPGIQLGGGASAELAGMADELAALLGGESFDATGDADPAANLVARPEPVLPSTDEADAKPAVRLGFSDGSSMELDSTDPAAASLLEAAERLTHRGDEGLLR